MEKKRIVAIIIGAIIGVVVGYYLAIYGPHDVGPVTESQVAGLLPGYVVLLGLSGALVGYLFAKNILEE